MVDAERQIGHTQCRAPRRCRDGGPDRWPEQRESALLSYFLTPAPPPGPVTLILAWPTFGIEESTLVIPADELAVAATRTVTLWPEQPEDERANPPRPPRPPVGGWFEQNPPGGSSID